MKKISSGRLCRSVALGALFTATSGFAFAQQTQPTVDTVQPAEEQEADDGDVVVITGSRIQNDTFTSASAMTVVMCMPSTDDRFVSRTSENVESYGKSPSEKDCMSHSYTPDTNIMMKIADNHTHMMNIT